MLECDCPPDDCAAHVRAYLQGDRAAGDHLARKFTPLVQSIAQRILGPARREEWDDARQAVFLLVFGKLDLWGAQCPFCKWLAVVAARRVIDLARTPAPPGGLPLGDLAERRPAGLPPETIDCIQRVLAELPPEWRRVYEMTIQGEPREAIARELGKSVRTIQYWLAAVRERLSACLET
jgi:DNA-directed RNA polymerase specialized sigma24 family protein